MSKDKTPSLVALLGLLEFAGYQNRHKLGEMIHNNKPDRDANVEPSQIRGAFRFFDEIASSFVGATGGAWPSKGINGLVDKFRGAGHTDEAEKLPCITLRTGSP